MIDDCNVEIPAATATIQAMRRQEKHYRSEDYTHYFDDVTDSEGDIEQWRFGLVDWCYTVADYLQVNRDTVAIAIINFDRFLSTRRNNASNIDDEILQLAAMTCLYTAIKMHEPEVLDPKAVSTLSGRFFTEQQIVDMEVEIVMTVQWRLNPPTPMSFVHCFLSTIPDLTDIERQTILQLTKHQVEMMVKEFQFVYSDASSIALAALSTSMEAVIRDFHPEESLQTISKIYNIDISARTNMIFQEKIIWISLKELQMTSVKYNNCLSFSKRYNNGRQKSITSVQDLPCIHVLLDELPY